jgi:biotin carboxyl carrier protein
LEEETRVEFEFFIDGHLRKISLEKKENFYIVSDGTQSFEADILALTPHVVSLMIKNRNYRVYIAEEKGKRHVFFDGQVFLIQQPSQESSGFESGEGKSAEDELVVKAPMPGKVIKINVREKEKVRKNQTLAIVEAMKMENEIKSSIDGFVAKIHCAPGDLVETENPLIELSLE